MSHDHSLGKGRVASAWTVAVLADLIQLPGNFAFFVSALSGVGVLAADIPLEMADMAMDTVVGFLLTGLLGFHWVLLPTFVIEMVPGLDAAPTWTACTAYVVHRRKKQGLLEA